MKGRGKQSQGQSAAGAAQQQSSSAMVAANAGSLLTAAIKPNAFSGEQQSWKDWEFSLLNYITTIDAYLSDMMAQAAASSTEIPLPQDGNDLVRARWLFALVGGLTRGSARRLVQNAGTALATRNGLELWRLMNVEWQPKSMSRRLALLLAILSPQFNENQDESAWKESFDAWEVIVQEYEQMSSRRFDEEVKAAVVLMGAPRELKPHLQLRSEELLTNYSTLTQQIKNWIQSRRAYQLTNAEPMEVDRVKGKGKGDKKKPAVECFLCKGNHFARNCPQNSSSSKTSQYSSYAPSSQSSSSSSYSSHGGAGGGCKGGKDASKGGGKGGKDSKGGKGNGKGGKSKGGKSKGGKNVRAVEEEWQENTWEGTYETVWEEEPWQQNEEEDKQEAHIESFGHHETAEEDDHDLWIY